MLKNHSILTLAENLTGHTVHLPLPIFKKNHSRKIRTNLIVLGFQKEDYTALVGNWSDIWFLFHCKFILKLIQIYHGTVKLIFTGSIFSKKCIMTSQYPICKKVIWRLTTVKLLLQPFFQSLKTVCLNFFSDGQDF
jgi:hypothetical protein